MNMTRSALILALVTASRRWQGAVAFSSFVRWPSHGVLINPLSSSFSRQSTSLRFSSQNASVLSTTTDDEQIATIAQEKQESSSDDDSDGAAAAAAWVKYGMLISSFTDGVVASPDAQAFLKYTLACSLLQERVRQAETAVRESVLASPCNGPDIDAFNTLESYDEQLQQSKIMGNQQSDENNSNSNSHSARYNDEAANRLFKSLNNNNNNNGDETTIRLLYIPTAMYALNPKSSNTPGKQRQRARADGKKRRNQVVKLLQDIVVEPQLPNTRILAITLDLDDGSLKQPVGSDDKSDFPTDGVEAFTKWEPHIVYVEGGNTFWLQHCLEKGNWEEPLRKACVGPDATSLYIGKSAGAIIAGTTVETATWKGWDDPSVVPLVEEDVSRDSTYEDWKGHQGLAMVGPSRSFFPHMSEDWELLVVEKKAELETNQAANVVCLGELDAYCVHAEDGDTTPTAILVSGNDPTTGGAPQ